MNISFKELQRNGPTFSFLCGKFPSLNKEKNRAGVFIGTHICQLCREPQSDVAVSGDEKAAWNVFRHVATDVVRNVKAVNFRNLWRIL